VNINLWIQLVSLGIVVACLPFTCLFLMGTSWIYRHMDDDRRPPRWVRAALWIARAK
jgi:hypothetical protein